MRFGNHAWAFWLIFLLGMIQRVASILSSGLGSDDEVKLVKYLFDSRGYNPLIRPVRNLTDSVDVQFGLALIQLISVDEKNQIMKTNVWLRMLWEDYQLKWEAADFGGITTIRILPHKVWKPDIVLFNNADGKYEVSYSPNVLIYNTGEVMWIPPAIYKSSCTIDVQYFPFDQQECEMKFGSWTFNGDQVKLGWYEGQMQVDLSDYVNSGTWDIMDVPGRMENKTGDTEGHSTAQIIFTLKMRRKTLFYTVNLIIPCVLISFLSVCVFYLPADAGEKMTMCISILLALVVFLLLVSKILPPTSMTIPLIAKYLLFTFIMNIFTILITVIIINWNFRTPRTHRMANWVRVLFLNYLPRVLLMKRPHHAERCNKKSFAHSNMQGERLPRDGNSSNSTNMAGTDMRGFSSTGVGAHAHTDLMELSDMHHPNCRINRSGHNRHNDQTQYDISGGGGSNNMPSESTFHMTPETHKAVEAVRFIAAHLKNEDDYAEILEDWRYIAMVIDRLQLCIFMAVTIGGTIGILVNAPHIFEYINQDEIKQKLKH